MPIVQYGAINLDAILVPGAYIVIEQPIAGAINGAPSNQLAIVGTATWGPVNSPTTFGSAQQGQAIFGPPQVRLFDMMTHVSTAALQGANNFKGVRVTDGTDTSASVEVLTNCIAFTSKYSGSGGNSIQVTIGAGGQVGTYNVTVAMPGVVSELYANVGLGLTGNALWVAIAAAVNGGVGVLRGPSQIVVATAGAGTTAPAAATYTLSGGTDGANGVTATTLVGNDGTMPRTGMYALRNTGTAVAMLADVSTSSTWSTQLAYGLSEGTYMIACGPSGDNIANAVATLQASGAAGPTSYDFKLLHGDWCYWNDPVNGLRPVSPQGFVAGFLANASPNQPALNQQLYGIAGTQTTSDNLQYSAADLNQLAQAGIDLVMNPSAGGNYFSCFLGHNTSTNQVTQSDIYTKMTNFEVASLNGPGGLGQFVGQLNDPQEQADVVGAVGAFLQAQADNGLIGNSANPSAIPYSVTLPASQNTQAETAIGYQFLNISITYWSIVEKLVATVIGGASVVIQRQGVSLA